jgi:cytochrome c oxidase subunit IV
MADEHTLPEPTEQIHLPGPSYLPALTAVGVTVAICGLIVSWWMVGVGLLVAAVAILRWVRETREDIAELPLEH